MKLTAETTVFDENAVQNKFSELVVDQDGIRTEVSKKVGNDEVISRINQSAESVKIQAQRVEVDGTLIVGKSAVDTAKADAISTASSDATTKANNAKADAISIASDDATAKANEARKYADNFVTYVSAAAGIKVHSVNDTSNYVQINSNGTDIVKGGVSVASYGDTARIGKTTGNHIVLDTNGLKLKSDATTTPLSIRFYRNSLTSLMSGEFECNGDTGAGHLKMNYLQTKTTSLLDAFYNDGSISKYAEVFLRADSLNGGESEAKITADSITMNGIVACSGSIKVSGHSTAIGTVQTESWIATSSSYGTNLTNAITLTAGTYVIVLTTPPASRTISIALAGQYFEVPASGGTATIIYSISSSTTIRATAAMSAATTYSYTERGSVRAVRIA